MQVISAIDYGYRTVLRVCHNPAAPHYVHSDGSTHPDANINGCDNPDTLERVCTYNRKVQEFIWDGDAQFIDGVRRDANSYWEELCQRCASPSTPLAIEGLVGRSI